MRTKSTTTAGMTTIMITRDTITTGMLTTTPQNFVRRDGAA